GGRAPLVIVKVSTAPLLVSRNASYGWPAAAAGSTQTPLTSVPPLVPGEHCPARAAAAGTGGRPGPPLAPARRGHTWLRVRPGRARSSGQARSPAVSPRVWMGGAGRTTGKSLHL